MLGTYLSTGLFGTIKLVGNTPVFVCGFYEFYFL